MPNFLSVIRRKIPRHFTQVLATLAVSLGPFAAGLGKGYSSPALASLQESKTSTFHVTAQEGSWVASLSLLGALFGCLFGGLMLQLGRKKSLLIVALPFSFSWLLTVFAQRVEMMYSTSFIGGFCSAVTLLATQVYVSEISHPEIRGCLSAVLKMAGHLGTLSSFALGAFLDWRQLATVAAGAPILLFLAILPIPETPSFLLYHGREEEACKSMAWLRSRGEDVTSEIETLRSNIMTKQKSFLPKCSSQFPFRQLFITCGLMFFQKFSGVTVFFHYAVPIFRQVFGRSLNPHGAAIVVVFLQLLGSMTSGLLIDTAGRLPLLTLSIFFISGSFFGFGLYNWMEESLPPSYPGFGPSLDWIPLTCVLFFTLFFSIGIGPISWLMVGELFPLEYRGFGGAVSTSFSYACAFAAVKTYVDLHAHVGLYGAFWIYSGVSVAGLFFVCCVVPETKGVELEEMEHHSVVQTAATTALNPGAGASPPNTTTVTSNTPAPSSASSNLVVSNTVTHNKPFIPPPTKDSYYPPPMQTPPGAKISPRPQLHLNLKLNNSFIHHNTNAFPDHYQPSSERESMPLYQYRHPPVSGPGRLMIMPNIGPTHSMPYEVIQQQHHHYDDLEDEFSTRHHRRTPPSLGYSPQTHHRYIEPYYYHQHRHAQHHQLPPSSLPPYHHHHDLIPEIPLLYSERSSLSHVPSHLEQMYNSEEESDYSILPYSSRLTTGPFRPKRGTVV